MIYNNILEAVGHTPMVRLNKMTDKNSAEILVKFEGLNVGGSIKTRTAYNMILQAEKEGKVTKDTIIVEADKRKSGNRTGTCRRCKRIQNNYYYA